MPDSKKIYLFNNYHNGDIITHRCLLKALVNFPHLDIVNGSFKDRFYLVGDIPIEHIISENNEEQGGCLGHLCPEGYIPLNMWCGTFQDIDTKEHHNWVTILETWNRHSEQNNLEAILPYKENEVPMIDFDYPCKIKTRGRAIYIENSTPRSDYCKYSFDMKDLGERYPEFNFYCTGSPDIELDNVIDCKDRNLVELSFISNSCEAILGKGSGAFLCTFTEANRRKPRAVFGFGAPKFWKYRESPLQYLPGEHSEVYKFLDEIKNNPLEII